MESVHDRKFTNPETGNKVQFESLPPGEQKKIREEHHEEHGAAKDKEDKPDKAPKKTWAERLKGLGDKARAFVADAPKAVKKFVEDSEHRKKVMSSAADTIRKAPGDYSKKFIHTAKEEVKEFKEAGEGVSAVLKGGTMSDPQKKAFKTVATHVALGLTAAILTSTGGPLAVAGAFGKGLVKHIAMKAVSKSLTNLHKMEELGHIGHGVAELLHTAAKNASTDDVMGNYLAAMVAEGMESLTDGDMETILTALGK